MTPRERVHAALRRQPVDRIPIFMWFHPETQARLGAHLEIPPARVAEALGNDVQQAWVGNNHAMEGIVHAHEGEGHVDDWGIAWERVGPFNQISHYPLANAAEAEIGGYAFPWHARASLLAQLQPLVTGSGEIFTGCDVSPCLFEMSCRLRGMEGALMDLATGSEAGAQLLQGAADFSVAMAQDACEQFPLDWLWTGDDVGGQEAMIMSPALWREVIRPHLESIVDVGQRHRLWVAYHSCGSIRPIIPDLVEMGVQVLNPVQCDCPGMDPVELKREFGNELAFMGGVDTIGLLPHSTAADVQRATEELLAAMTVDGGGYILAASHTVPPETPLENIYAMYAAAGLSRQEIADRAAGIRAAAGASSPQPPSHHG